MTREEVLRRYRRARTALQKYHGVIGVGLGSKERYGSVTQEVAFRVYVRDKKPESLLLPGERIPPVFAGVLTDIIAAGPATPTASKCQDKNKYSTLVGGITICPQNAPGLRGTLGFFATINGVNGPDNIVLVTNHHVLNPYQQKEEEIKKLIKDTIYQPDLTSSNNTLNNPIGEIFKLPEKGDHQSGGDTFYVDAAAGRLDIRISSCCNSNCGVSFANEIHGLDLNSSNAITDVGTARKGDLVYKVGRETGRTVGRVENIKFNLPILGLAITNAIEIKPVKPNCNQEMKFSAEGDSGAAVVNEQGQLVGLLFSAAPNPANALACHIAPVLDILKVTAITSAHPVHNNPAAVGMSANLEALIAAAADALKPALAKHDAVPFTVEDQKTAIANMRDTLTARVTALAEDLSKRILTAQSAVTATAALTSPAARVQQLRTAARTVVGDEMQILPRFKLGVDSGLEFGKCVVGSATLLDDLKASGRRFPVDDWLYGLARVREKMNAWENLAVLSEAFGASSASLSAVQLPFAPADQWLGLEFDSAKAHAGNRLLYTAHFVTLFNRNADQCGLVFDEWPELVPGTEVTSGITFHFDRPSSQPPQVMLLAVPAQLKGRWTWDDLVATINETLDAAKTRGVEPAQVDASAYAQFLPATLMAVTLYQIHIATNLALNNRIYDMIRS